MASGRPDFRVPGSNSIPCLCRIPPVPRVTPPARGDLQKLALRSASDLARRADRSRPKWPEFDALWPAAGPCRP